MEVKEEDFGLDKYYSSEDERKTRILMIIGICLIAGMMAVICYEIPEIEEDEYWKVVSLLTLTFLFSLSLPALWGFTEYELWKIDQEEKKANEYKA